MSQLIKRQDAIDAVAKLYRYESDRMTALQEVPIITEREIRAKAFDEVIDRILPYGSFCVKWNDGMTKEEIAQEVINQAKEQFIDILEQLKAGGRDERNTIQSKNL